MLDRQYWRNSAWPAILPSLGQHTELCMRFVNPPRVNRTSLFLEARESSFEPRPIFVEMMANLLKGLCAFGLTPLLGRTVKWLAQGDSKLPLHV